MPVIVKNTILHYIPQNIETKKTVKRERVFDFNEKAVGHAGKIIYLCERELRVNDNPALNFAAEKSEELSKPLKIVHPQIIYEYEPKQKFIDKQISRVKNDFINSGFNFETVNKKRLADYLNEIEIAVLITDFNPILNRDWLKNFDFKIYEIDGHNIVPARIVSNKQEYNAKMFRQKLYLKMYPFMTEFEKISPVKTEAEEVLADFIQNKLPDYAEFKNNPNKNVISGLSKYLNLGFISSGRVALEVIKSDATDENKESFLEELIIRKELADNFCLYCKDFKSFSCVPNWAKESLSAHKFDIRAYIYTLAELENAQTHDILWNAAQKQLVKEGIIHGYLRMYWAKKILEWTENPDIALETAILLNDKYAYDAPSASGYVNILWAIAGLHDRAFADYIVTGKIRRMTFNSIKKKFDIEKYY